MLSIHFVWQTSQVIFLIILKLLYPKLFMVWFTVVSPNPFGHDIVLMSMSLYP